MTSRPISPLWLVRHQDINCRSVPPLPPLPGRASPASAEAWTGQIQIYSFVRILGITDQINTEYCIKWTSYQIISLVFPLQQALSPTTNNCTYSTLQCNLWIVPSVGPFKTFQTWPDLSRGDSQYPSYVLRVGAILSSRCPAWLSNHCGGCNQGQTGSSSSTDRLAATAVITAGEVGGRRMLDNGSSYN